MISTKEHGLFWTVLFGTGALLVAEGWLWHRGQLDALRADALLAQRRVERARLAGHSPAPTPENEREVQQARSQLEAHLADRRATLRVDAGGASTATPMVTSADAYFALADFVARTRALSAREHVMLRPNECFGFAAYAHQGPTPALIAPVLWQRSIIDSLLSELISAHPLALVSAQRERPRLASERSRRKAMAAGQSPGSKNDRVDDAGLTEDCFRFDGPLALRTLGVVDSEAFRLEFTGRTEVLRDFLNRMAILPRPVLVREVQVEPVADVTKGAAAISRGVAGTGATTAVSRFAVFVELLEPFEVQEGAPP